MRVRDLDRTSVLGRINGYRRKGQSMLDEANMSVCGSANISHDALNR